MRSGLAEGFGLKTECAGGRRFHGKSGSEVAGRDASCRYGRRERLTLVGHVAEVQSSRPLCHEEGVGCAAAVNARTPSLTSLKARMVLPRSRASTVELRVRRGKRLQAADNVSSAISSRRRRGMDVVCVVLSSAVAISSEVADDAGLGSGVLGTRKKAARGCSFLLILLNCKQTSWFDWCRARPGKWLQAGGEQVRGPDPVLSTNESGSSRLQEQGVAARRPTSLNAVGTAQRAYLRHCPRQDETGRQQTSE